MKHENAIAQIHGLIDDCAARMREQLARLMRAGCFENIPQEHWGIIAKAFFAAALRQEMEVWQPVGPEAQRLAEWLYRELVGE